MADTKISALTAVTTLAAADEFAVNQSNASKKVSASVLREFLGSDLVNVSTAAQSPSAGATTYLTSSSVSVPSGKLRAGSSFMWDIIFTKTGAGTAARSVLIKVGTAGTTADATIVTLTSGTPSANADTGYMRVIFTIRTIGAAATSRGSYAGFHQLSTTGLFPNETEVISAAGSTFDSTTANLIVGLAITAGASEAMTFEQINVQAFNL
jgi:hypothetical protein